jgi:hypothetical protein
MTRMLRQIVLLFFVFFSPALFAQADSVVDVPGLISKPYYTEYTTFGKQKDFIHSIGYNAPHSVDEEHSYTFRFSFTDFDSLVPGKAYDLVTDSAHIHCQFGVLSAWTWDYDKKATFSGTVTVISKTKKEIIVEEDVRIRDGEGQIWIYKGRKTYVRRKEK